MPTPESVSIVNEIGQESRLQDYAQDVAKLVRFYEQYVTPFTQNLQVGLVREVGIGAQTSEPLAIASTFPQASGFELSDLDRSYAEAAKDWVELLAAGERRKTIQNVYQRMSFPVIDATSPANFPNQVKSTLTICREMSGRTDFKRRMIQALAEMTERHGLLVITTLAPLKGVARLDEQEARAVLGELEASGRVRKVSDEAINPPLQVGTSNDDHIFVYEVI